VAVRGALGSGDFRLLCFGVGGVIGVFYAVSTLIGQWAVALDYSADTGGTLGVIMVAVGLAGYAARQRAPNPA
jgi:hypothetical protein